MLTPFGGLEAPAAHQNALNTDFSLSIKVRTYWRGFLDLTDYWQLILPQLHRSQAYISGPERLLVGRQFRMSLYSSVHDVPLKLALGKHMFFPKLYGTDNNRDHLSQVKEPGYRTAKPGVSTRQT